MGNETPKVLIRTALVDDDGVVWSLDFPELLAMCRRIAQERWQFHATAREIANALDEMIASGEIEEHLEEDDQTLWYSLA